MEKHEGRVALAPGDTTAVFEIFIKTTPERLWEAITDPDMRARYTFGVADRVRLERGLHVRVVRARRDRHRGGGEPRGRPAPAARPDA